MIAILFHTSKSLSITLGKRYRFVFFQIPRHPLKLLAPHCVKSGRFDARKRNVVGLLRLCRFDSLECLRCCSVHKHVSNEACTCANIFPDTNLSLFWHESVDLTGSNVSGAEVYTICVKSGLCVYIRNIKHPWLAPLLTCKRHPSKESDMCAHWHAEET